MMNSSMPVGPTETARALVALILPSHMQIHGYVSSSGSSENGEGYRGTQSSMRRGQGATGEAQCVAAHRSGVRGE